VPYVSAAYPYPIFAWPLPFFWGLVGMTIGALLALPAGV
jgi:hypothetical protein